MNKDRGIRRRTPRGERALKAACISAAVAMAAPAAAFQIDTGSPDLELTLDTTLRYNAAMRTGERDLRLVNSPAVDEGNWLFGKNDTALSRFDVYTEFDLNYKKNMGLRLSAAGWYDNNFPTGAAATRASRPFRTMRGTSSRPTSTAITRARPPSSWMPSPGATSTSAAPR